MSSTNQIIQIHSSLEDMLMESDKIMKKDILSLEKVKVKIKDF